VVDGAGAIHTVPSMPAMALTLLPTPIGFRWLDGRLGAMALGVPVGACEASGAGAQAGEAAAGDVGGNF